MQPKEGEKVEDDKGPLKKIAKDAKLQDKEFPFKNYKFHIPCEYSSINDSMWGDKNYP